MPTTVVKNSAHCVCVPGTNYVNKKLDYIESYTEHLEKELEFYMCMECKRKESEVPSIKNLTLARQN